MSPLKPRRPPRDALGRLDGHLARRERPLAWAAYGGDERAGHLVATDRGLWEVPVEGEPGLLPWDEIDRARWDDGRLLVQEASLPQRRAVRRWEVPAPAALPEVIHDRVKASILVDQWHRLSGGGGVRVLGRRSPVDDRVRWFLLYDRPGDAEDPTARLESEQRLREAKEMIGA